MNRLHVTQGGRVLLLVVSTSCPLLCGAIRPEAKVIGKEAHAAASVHAADLDADGDLDVLSASTRDNKISWYANVGAGLFGPRQVITTAADMPGSVYAADLDGDNDIDVLSASLGDNKIAWYANDGSGHFGPQQVVTTEAHHPRSVYAADLDGDRDLDVLSASDIDGKVAWYANNGSGHFSPQQVITTTDDDFGSVYAADLDGDGDLDVLSASFGPSNADDHTASIAWYANNGSGHFAPQQVISTTPGETFSVYAADLDGDGDMDVLSTHVVSTPWQVLSGGVTWYANDGSGHFGSPQVVAKGASYAAMYVRAADLNGDKVLDVLSNCPWDRKIVWYVNDGSGHFGSPQVISTETYTPVSVYAADMDSDGDLDVLSASVEPMGAGQIAWYENK
ncbi:MAG: VCBS repeat-containing protein [Sedimentisphaerales bacterium]|nr:VCBS repeat-containing protein [Sedimentisphaerales bacterium]